MPTMIPSLSSIVCSLGLALVTICCLVSGGSLGTWKATYDKEKPTGNLENHGDRNLANKPKFTDDQRLYIRDGYPHNIGEEGIPDEYDLYPLGDGIFDDSETEYIEDKFLENELDGFKATSHVETRLKRSFVTNITDTNSTLDQIARSVTMRTVSLIEGLKSFNNITETSAERREKFVTRVIGLLMVLVVGDGNESLEGMWDSETIADFSRLRHYTQAEINGLKIQRSSIVETRNREMELIHGVDSKISVVNGTVYDCTSLISHMKENSGSSTFVEMDSGLKSENIFVFKCTDQMKIESLEDLIRCVDMEIAKGEKSIITGADFYLTTIDILGSIAQLGYRLNHKAVGRDLYNYDDPILKNLEN